jgi:acyl-CoA synthetase (AMP-forming)/AMP-acid ligase II
MLVGKNSVGEIWLSGPSLPIAFQKLSVQSSHAFRARPILIEGGQEKPLADDFARTGVMGFAIEGRVFLTGMTNERMKHVGLDGKVTAHFPEELAIGLQEVVPGVDAW